MYFTFVKTVYLWPTRCGSYTWKIWKYSGESSVRVKTIYRRPVALTGNISIQILHRMDSSDSTVFQKIHRFYLLAVDEKQNLYKVRGGADKSLTWPTSRCRRTKSTASLEREVCSCAELQVFSCYRRWREACKATRAISTTSRRELSICFSLQDKATKEIHAILIETLGDHAPSYATVKNWVAQFKRGDFSSCDAPRSERPKTVTTPEIIDQIHTLPLLKCYLTTL